MKNRLLVNAVMHVHQTHNFLELSVCCCSKSVSYCVCICARLRSRGAEQWGRACWLIKKSVLITIHGCLCLYERLSPSGLHHTVWHSTSQCGYWETGNEQEEFRVSARSTQYPHCHSLTNPPPPHPSLTVLLLSNTPMIVECQSPRPPILSGPADCNPTTHPLHLCRHTMGSESCLLATNPSEKVAVALKRRHERERQRGR